MAKVYIKEFPPKKILKNRRDCHRQFVATIGVFDGLHMGHRFILKELIKKANRLSAYPLVITFWPHPQEVISGKFVGHIMNILYKRKALHSLGISNIWCFKSTRQLLRMDGFSFVKKITRRFPLKGLVVGEDFKFGYRGRYSVEELREISHRLGIHLSVVRKIKYKGIVVSSSHIRELIYSGNFKKAEILLGRAYFMEGKVVRGNRIGRKLGYPTANVINYDRFIVPEAGVYAVYVGVGRKIYLGAANIGFKPTLKTKRKKHSLEVHIINFNKNILNKKIRIIFLEKLREEKRFPSLSSLRKAIEKDTALITSKYSTPQGYLTQLFVS